MSFRKDLGAVSSYALAVEAGYEGTEEEFAAEQAEFAKNAKLVAEAKTAAESAKKGAEDAKSGAETAAVKAATAAIRQPVINSGTWWLWDFEKGEYVDSGVSVRPEDAVLFVPQEKSEDEKAQARANIGALAESEVKDSELIESAENATVLVLEGENIKRVAGDKLGGAKSWNDLTDKPFEDTRKTEALIPLNTVEGNIVDWGYFKVADSINFDINDVTHITRSSNYDDLVFENAPVVLDREPGAADIVTPAEWGEVVLGVYIATQEEADAYWDKDPATNPFTPGLYMYVGNAEDGQLVDVTFSLISNTGELKPIEGKYLPKGTPWIEEGGMVEILPETTVTIDADSGEGVLPGALIPVTVGESYTVNWNGVEYNSPAIDPSILGGTEEYSAVLVNDGANMETGEGAVFLILIFDENSVTELGMSAAIIAMDGSTSVTLSITSGSESVHKLDNRCLDLAWLPVITEAKGEAMFEEQPSNAITPPNRAYDLLEAGMKVVLVIDGVEHISTLVVDRDDDTGITLYGGNHVLFPTGDYPDTGEDWFIQFDYVYGSNYADSSILMVFADGSSHTVSCYVFEEVPNKLPAEFLPDGIGGDDAIRIIIEVSEDDTYGTFVKGDWETWYDALKNGKPTNVLIYRGGDDGSSFQSVPLSVNTNANSAGLFIDGMFFGAYGSPVTFRVVTSTGDITIEAAS